MILITQEGCPPCNMVKQAVRENNWDVKILDVRNDSGPLFEKMKNEFIKQGMRTVPVLYKDGKMIPESEKIIEVLREHFS